MLDWHSCQICYPFEIKLLLLLFQMSIAHCDDLYNPAHRQIFISEKSEINDWFRLIF